MLADSLLSKATSALSVSVATTLATSAFTEIFLIAWVQRSTPGDLVKRLLAWSSVPTNTFANVQTWLAERADVVVTAGSAVAALTVLAVAACVKHGATQLWDNFRWLGVLSVCALLHVEVSGPAAYVHVVVAFATACALIAAITRSPSVTVAMAFAPLMLAVLPALMFIAWVSHGINPLQQSASNASLGMLQGANGIPESSDSRAESLPPLSADQPAGGTIR